MGPNGRAEPTDEAAITRVDLHLHSHASGAATNWWVKALGLGFETRESYTPPADAYALAKGAGMDFVTLTDHETIDGVLTLADRPDVLVGEEVSALFPEDGSAVDVLVYGLDGAAHVELQARRTNVYRLVDFLRDTGLVHVLAHPMFDLGGRLDRAGVEKRLVLFGLWEFVNGARPSAQNRLAREVARDVGPGELRQLARRHGLPRPLHRAIRGTGGSDDHGGLHVATTYTVLPRVHSAADLLAALAAGETRPAGDDGSAGKLTHTGFKLAGAAFAAGEQVVPTPSPTATATDPSAPPSPLGAGGRRTGADQLLQYLPLLPALGEAQIRGVLLGLYERRIAGALGNAATGFPLLGALGSIGSFVEGHVPIAPYVAMHGYFGREGEKTRALRRQLLPDGAAPVRVGVFVDELDEIHGVATMYRNLQRLAAGTRGDTLRIIQCGPSQEGDGDGDPVCLRPIATLPLPLYEGRTLAVPSLLDVLDLVADEGYDLLQVATPGPLGLAALIAAGTLKLPIVGAYHTEFGTYARVLSGDALVAEIVEGLVREFYERCTVVAVPSASTALDLRARGYRIDRFETLRNGVDTVLYDPSHRDEAHRRALGGGRTLLLYAGRVSREKGLERLADGYLALRDRRDDVHLVIAGDGPYRAELEAKLGPAATCTGFLHGDELARTYASCDLFVFPSTTDTLGRAVAEAQASGLPAVVFGLGGPRECIRPDVSGFVVDPGDETAFLARIEELLDDPAKRDRMARAARRFAQTLSWPGVLAALFALYRDVLGRESEVRSRESEVEEIRTRDTTLGPSFTAPSLVTT